MLYLLYKKQIQKVFINAFAGDCLVMPENPYSKDNPDMLVRNGTTLYAIFIPMYHERKNLDHLLRRVFSSELSYGSKLHTVLILKEDDKLSGYGENVLSAVFCHIARGIDDAIRYVSSRENVGRNWMFIGEAKQWLYRLYDVNNLTIEFSNKQYGVQKTLADQQLDFGDFSSPSWSLENKSRMIKNVAYSRYSCMCIKKKVKDRSFREGFENIMTQSFLKNFYVEGGYLVPNNNIVDNIFGVATDWELYSEDNVPNDYFRTLVFSGVLPLNILDEEKLGNIHEFYIDVQNRMRYEHFKKD